MVDLPLVSAVICTFRRPDVVKNAIRSVQNQTYPNIEIIVVDDASPDRTKGAVEEIGNGRIKYLRHEQNRGPSAGRNTGIDAANGEFIAFLDDDDEWYPKKLEIQVRSCKENGFDAVLSASMSGDGGVRRFGRPEVTMDDLRRGNDFAPGSGLMARASVLRQLRFDESISQGEDWDILIRLAQMKYRIGYVSEPLYRVNDGNYGRLTNKGRNIEFEDLEKRMRVIYKHEEFFGQYWFSRHIAGMLLSHFWHRKEKLRQISYAIRRCGVTPVAAVFAEKVTSRIKS